MRAYDYKIFIPCVDGRLVNFIISFNQFCLHEKIEVPNVCVISLHKWNDHNYSFESFFYKKRVIQVGSRLTSKKQLYSAIQRLLQQEL